jgi:hypothetical protein
MSRGSSVSQTVATSATNASSGEVSQLSQSQPDEFPLGVLPEPVLVFAFEAANALGVDPALVAGPCLATLAGCVPRGGDKAGGSVHGKPRRQRSEHLLLPFGRHRGGPSRLQPGPPAASQP